MHGENIVVTFVIFLINLKHGVSNHVLSVQKINVIVVIVLSRQLASDTLESICKQTWGVDIHVVFVITQHKLKRDWFIMYYNIRIKPLYCKSCVNTYGSSNSLRKHTKIHTRSYLANRRERLNKKIKELETQQSKAFVKVAVSNIKIRVN